MTIDYYDGNADEYARKTVGLDMSELRRAFTDLLRPEARILDAGCGSGRDTKAFMEQGYVVRAFDASARLAAIASAHTGIEVACMRFDELEPSEPFDGVWACSSLLHVPRNELVPILRRIANALRPGGVLYASFKLGQSERMDEGRYFNDLTAATLSAAVEQAPPLAVHKTWVTTDVRPEQSIQWLNALIRRTAEATPY